LLFFPYVVLAQQTWPTELLITPEKTNYQKTSTHSEVMAFLDFIKTKSPNIHIISMGKSLEGKDIPVAVLSRPAIRTSEEAKASGKPVIYIQGNIHAGEVEGKEAVMILMRDILLGGKNNLLDNQIILFAPIYNTDSNDKMEKGIRPSQEDSPMEVGLRENSQGLDLNRDAMKMEALETNGLFQSIILPWDPQLFVDLHTTNGTWHAYSLTWAPSYHSSGEYPPYDFINNKMLPEISEKVRTKNNLDFGPYGDYDLTEGWPLKNFYTYNHHPRYLVNQFGLRNRMAILSESFAHERFYQRIYSTYTFVNEILEYSNNHAKEIVTINKEADDQAIQQVVEQAGKITKGVKFKMVPLQKLNDFVTYDYITSIKEDGSLEYFRTGEIVKYNNIDYFAKFESEQESTLPNGYVIPAEFTAIVENLKKHGVKVEKLNKTKSFAGEIFTIEKFVRADRAFQGHAMAKVEGKFSTAKRKFMKGDYLVDMAQPLTNLIFYLLEPQSDDGLLTWNFFDTYLEKKNISNQPVEYPVFKYIQIN
ncbi:MAG: hypothetical protein JJE09_08140, partial [Bacteroidia bacterium]|nr:hypothetical protein [Bacteroidia bacterium]